MFSPKKILLQAGWQVCDTFQTFYRRLVCYLSPTTRQVVELLKTWFKQALSTVEVMEFGHYTEVSYSQVARFKRIDLTVLTRPILRMRDKK